MCRWVVLSVFLAVILLGSSGDLALPQLWLYVALYALAAFAGIVAQGPELREEWRRPGAGGKDWLMRRVQLFILAAHWMIAGLDVGRMHWSDTVPLGLQMLGFFFFAGSTALRCWAMKVNNFYSSVVRVQGERGHRVISGGPYGWVRHPGYLSAIVNLISSGLALGSWLSLCPIAVAVALFPRRIVIEERLLLRELQGYSDYANNVRYRLVPLVW
jgi:protein-S-isoprenylcysteine O-methyltransferase Ste14